MKIDCILVFHTFIGRLLKGVGAGGGGGGGRTQGKSNKKKL